MADSLDFWTFWFNHKQNKCEMSHSVPDMSPLSPSPVRVEMWVAMPARKITNKRNAGMDASTERRPLRNREAKTKELKRLQNQVGSKTNFEISREQPVAKQVSKSVQA